VTNPDHMPGLDERLAQRKHAFHDCTALGWFCVVLALLTAYAMARTLGVL